MAREFTPEFLELRAAALEWIRPYYDGEHLRRAGHWMLELDPEAAEPLVIAALTHDMERSVPGGPKLDWANMRWDDRDYNRAHCDRSARVVADWLRAQGASERFVSGIDQPIREHEFGGSPEGDLMQAADSISFLEVNAPLVTSWVTEGRCTHAKAIEKLDFMNDRVRLERARPFAREQHERAVAELDRRLAEIGLAS